MDFPIRVLQVVTHMNRGGLETMLMNYYRNIDRTKVQFDFLTHRPESEIKDYDEEIRRLGGNIYHVSPLNPFSRTYRKQLRCFFSTHPEYQIVHVHQDCMSGIVLKEAQECGVPVRVAHSHNASQDRNFKYVIKKIYKKNIIKYATSLFSCGSKAGQWMFGTDDFSILHNAIDTEQFTYSNDTRNSVREKLEITENFVVGHVGRFCEVKNHKFLIDVFNELKKKVPEATLLLVGTGELQDEIQSKVVSLGLDDSVIFAGLRSDVNELMQAMDVFVFPSLYEGLPVTLVEAQAASLPCIVSDSVSSECRITDLVKQVPLDADIDKWVEEIVSYRFHKKADMSEDIRKSGYDIKENVELLERFYCNAMNGDSI